MVAKEKDQKQNTIKNIALIFKERFIGADISKNAVVVAYYILLSWFPLVIVMGSILPFFNIDPNSVLPYIKEILPETIMPIMEPIIRRLLTYKSGGLLSLSIIGTLWSASKGINYLQLGINQAYGLPKKNDFLFNRIISIFTILLIVLLLFALLIIFSFGSMFLDYIANNFDILSGPIGAFDDLKWPAATVVLFAILTLLYASTPNAKISIKYAIPGAIFSTIGWLALIKIFAIYVKYFLTSFSNYGAFSTFFVIMFWLNIASYIIIIGAVINATIHEANGSEIKYKEVSWWFGFKNKIIKNVKKLVSKNRKKS